MILISLPMAMPAPHTTPTSGIIKENDEAGKILAM